MQTKTPTALILLLIVMLAGCEYKAKKTGQEKEHALAAYDLDPRLKEADSLVVVFYKDPYGEDSLRYTRYYTQVPVTDPGGLRAFQQQLVSTFSKKEKKSNCRGEGKIWCFIKGKIFQTLYFSTRCDDCCYVYLIKDGDFYYTAITQNFTSWLNQLKPLSIELRNEALKTEN